MVMLIRYFDFGLYKARELLEIYNILQSITPNFEIYGFEACKKLYDDIISTNPKLVTDKIENLYNLAISSQHNDMIKLYYDKRALRKGIGTSQGGEGNSIYSSKYNVSKKKFETVKSCIFSQFLDEKKIDCKKSFNMIRCNIEGAEYDLFNDLIDNKLHDLIQIYCGSGIDVVKIRDFTKNGIDKLYFTKLKNNNINILPYTWPNHTKTNMRELIMSKIPK